MPTEDLPNGYWTNGPNSQIYIGDPIPNVPDSAGNQPAWVPYIQQPAIPFVQPSPQVQPVFNPFTFTVASIPKDGDIRWNLAADAAEIFNGNEWIDIITAQQLRDLYGEVKKAHKEKSSFEQRFQDIIREEEGMELSEDEAKKIYIEEMTARTMDLIKKSLKNFVKMAEEKGYTPQLQINPGVAQPLISYGSSTGQWTLISQSQ